MTDTTLTTAPPSAHAASEDRMNARDRSVLTLLLISTFVVILNETIMGVALPSLMADLSISASAGQWLTAAFMLTMAVVIPITGFLLQRFNTRPMFIAAMSLFSVGTLVAAIAPGFTVLLLARVIQASGTAIMFPLLITSAITLVPEKTRGRVMGNISIVISVAPAIGPIISGIILSSLSWRFMFVVVLPISVAALIVGGILMKNITTPRKTRIDVLSVILSALGFGGLVYGLSNLGTPGASAYATLLPLVVGGVALVAFILRQFSLQRRDAALLDLRTFTSRNFTFSIIMFGIAMMSMFGTIVLLPIYMQNVIHISPVNTGLLLLPGGLLMGLLAPIVGRIYDRIGPTALLVVGSIIVSADLWGMTLLTATSSFWWVLAAHVALSVGLALIFTPLFTASLASLKPELYSHGSAVVGTIQQVAGAAGIALFVTIFTARQAALAGQGASNEIAIAGGFHNAILVGAIISVLAIVAAVFIRKQPSSQFEGAQFEGAEFEGTGQGAPAGH
ncbi:MAG: transporter [Glaciihabitans sp.]|nr:transporter [Glaciihabitans sp.]